MKALHLRGSIKYEALQLDDAVAIFQRVIEFGQDMDDPSWVARGSYARANCEVDRGNLADASMLFHTALVIFREIGPAHDRICTEWGLARVVLHGGKPSDALHRLRNVTAAFEELGMVANVAFVGLDMADALLMLNRPEQVSKVAAHSFRSLKNAGILTSALTALAYLKEAAASGQLSPNVIQGVRTFLRRAERNPELIFAPPPATPD